MGTPSLGVMGTAPARQPSQHLDSQFQARETSPQLLSTTTDSPAEELSDPPLTRTSPDLPVTAEMRHSTGTGSQLSFRVSQLGRSAFGRRPSQFLADAALSADAHRTPSKMSTRLSVRSPTGDRNVSAISAHQQALLAEVMKEEGLAIANHEKEEQELDEREQEELKKEEERSKSDVLKRAPSRRVPDFAGDWVKYG